MRDLGLTFAGGGNRCFYQQGLLERWGDILWPRVAAVAAASAGAAISVLMLSGRADLARVHWDGLRKGLTKNLDPLRLLRGEPLAPHGRIYRSTLIHALEEGGLERLRALPFPLYVLCAVPPARLRVGPATWLGLGAYALEKKLRPLDLHPRSGELIGFRELVCDVRECTDEAEVADLILASSATPPFTPVGVFRGHSLLDGGLVDSAPASVVERTPEVRRTLVQLTRPYPAGAVGVRGKRLYLSPSEPLPVHRWDYREAAPIEDTLAHGRRDAERLGPTLDAWLKHTERTRETAATA
jgi:predicted acylesterase/phospholipase RssA